MSLSVSLYKKILLTRCEFSHSVKVHFMMSFVVVQQGKYNGFLLCLILRYAISRYAKGVKILIKILIKSHFTNFASVTY